jgi:aspartate aminotransferase
MGLSAITNVECPVPGGAFYAVAKLPIDDADAFCQWMLESFEHDGNTVMMAPNTGFYATDGMGKQEVRLAYVLRQEEIQKAVQCIAAGLQVYPGRIAD